MGMEIERKFLVSGEGWQSAAGDAADLVQGYLATGHDGVVVRIRLARDQEQGVLTIKAAGDGLSRPEFEYAVPGAEASELLALCGDAVLHKRRHRVPVGGHVWEVDVFAGALEGLILAEVELQHPDEPVDLPDWVGRELTHLREFTNYGLCLDPAPALALLGQEP